eukprot:CAMPEP_0119532982 /NCGR_PEP_ID=MMETSP1344-20130328/46429_1 /TAXON_ID=236787 /ORGANISM="Florenciella parvula, Strain CCMP2471" /LENGTH=79 /DNA_ID=CAMNT_0007573689 /DNA_START=13 /DNA_END=247 /DNA_ORIENTATION=-
MAATSMPMTGAGGPDEVQPPPFDFAPTMSLALRASPLSAPPIASAGAPGPGWRRNASSGRTGAWPSRGRGGGRPSETLA